MHATFNEFRETFSSVFMEEMERRVRDYKATLKLPFYEPVFDQLLEILRGGKRIRPYILMLAHGAIPGAEETQKSMLKTAMALECFHAFCLVHDDIMDRSERRRGMVTVHEFLRRQLETEARVGQLVEDANGQAMLIGDLLHAWSQELLLDIEDGFKGVVSEFHQLVKEVVAGQMMDVDFTTRLVVSTEDVERKNHLKTATYTFARPVRMGLAIRGADDSIIDDYAVMASKLGDAFQLQDDYLDIFGAPDATGKGSMRDIEEGQQTFFTTYVTEHGTDSHKQLLQQILGKPIVGNESEIRTMLIESGVESAAKERMAEQFAFVKERLTVLKPANVEQWLALIQFLESRSF